MKKKLELIQLEMKFNHIKKYYHILRKMSYQSYSVSLTEGQKANLARAYKNRSPITIRLKNEQLRGNVSLLLTKTEINRINKSIADKTGVDIGISKKQISAQSKNGGFLGALASFFNKNSPSNSSKNSTKSCGLTRTGALGGLASTGVSKILGNGITIPLTKQQEIINRIGPYLTSAQINQMLKTNKLKLTKRQSQDGRCLPLLIGALGSLKKDICSLWLLFVFFSIK